MRLRWSGRGGVMWALAVTGACLFASRPAAQGLYANPLAENMRLIGTHPLDGRATYWPTVHRQQGRWIAYVGHQSGEAVNALTGKVEVNGVSVLDVTDPANPRMLTHIPGPGPAERGGSEHVRVCDGSVLPAGEADKVYMLRSYGRQGHQLWDVTVPEKPALVSDVVMGLVSTHKNWWDCESGVAYTVGAPPGWSSTQIMMVYDISNPRAIRHVRDYGLPGMEPGGSGKYQQPLHGPIKLGDRVYLAWGFNRNGVIQIVDNNKLLKGDPSTADPLAPTAKNLAYPEIGRLEMPTFWGAHTTYPILQMPVTQYEHDGTGKTRDYVLVVSEATASDCTSAQHMAWMVDITDPAHPYPVSTLSTPEKGVYCGAGGRYGTHGSNESFSSTYYKKLVFLAYFNAGLRIFDIRDPLHPVEVASYVPAVTPQTMPSCPRSTAPGGGRGAGPAATTPPVGAGRAAGPPPASTADCKVSISTNNVDVDDRGLIFIVDRVGTGMHILELTGKPREITQMGVNP